MARVCSVGKVTIGPGHPLAIIAGPCLLESPRLGSEIAGFVREQCSRLGLGFIFKASFDKANRTSIESARGPGLEAGLACLRRIGSELGVPVTTDIHAPDQAEPVARVADLIQIPAFLCRQTDLLLAAGRAAKAHGRAVNIKKGQFLSPEEMRGPVEKSGRGGCSNVLLTERGTFFGYGRLVNDFLGVGELMSLDVEGGSPPVCFDCTHSTQAPGRGEGGKVTGGRPDLAPLLARAAVAAGVHALFLECHPDPGSAPSDGATMLRLADVPALLAEVAAIRAAAKRAG